MVPSIYVIIEYLSGIDPWSEKEIRMGKIKKKIEGKKKATKKEIEKQTELIKLVFNGCLKEYSY